MIAEQGRARREGRDFKTSIKLTIAARASVYDLIERRIVPRSRWRKKIDAMRLSRQTGPRRSRGEAIKTNSSETSPTRPNEGAFASVIKTAGKVLGRLDERAGRKRRLSRRLSQFSCATLLSRAARDQSIFHASENKDDASFIWRNFNPSKM